MDSTLQIVKHLDYNKNLPVLLSYLIVNIYFLRNKLYGF